MPWGTKQRRHGTWIMIGLMYVPPIKLSTLNDANIEQDGIWLLSNLTSFLQLYWASLFCRKNKGPFFGTLSNESL